MSRLLAFVALLVFVWLLVRRARLLLASPRGREIRAVWRLLRQLAATVQGSPPQSSSRATAGPGARRGDPFDRAGRADRSGRGAVPRSGTLVRCSVCGTHVPAETALRRSSDVFCSAACQGGAVP